MYKDEINRKVNTEIFKHELKKLVELENLCQVYKGMIREDLKSNFVSIDKDTLQALGLYDQYYTKDSLLKDLELELIALNEKYNKLLKDYQQEKNKTWINKLFKL
jgi:hypothetical protein